MTPEAIPAAQAGGLVHARAPVLSFFRVMRRRALLAEALKCDPAQPQDYAAWLREARSIEELHATCPRPGWLVYCAYFAELPQDLILDGALSLGRHATSIDARAPFPATYFDRLPDLAYPDLRATIRDALASAPGADAWCQAVPSQYNPDLAYADDILDGILEDDGGEVDEPAQARGPYRVEAAEAVDRARAAAYALTLEAFAHRQRGLREALTARSAAAAALFTTAFEAVEPRFHEKATTLLRVAYLWPTAGR